MELTEFTDKVVTQFANAITDKVFSMVQNDPELLREYQRLVSNRGIDTVNRHIGRIVKMHFHLKDDNRKRNWNPRSGLIRSHQILK